MSRTTTYLLGPELVWFLMLAFAGIFVTLNQPVTGPVHMKLMGLNWYLPTIGIMLAFVPLFWAIGNQWWWLVRVGLSSLIGVALLVGYLCKAASYDDIRNLGIGAGFFFFVYIGWTILAFLWMIAGFFQLVDWFFLPVLKWILILLSVFILAMKFIWDHT